MNGADTAIRIESNRNALFTGIRWGRFVFWLFAGVFLMVGTLFAWHRTEDFLDQETTASALPEAEDFAGQSPNLMVEGIPLCVDFPDPSCLRRRILERVYIWSRYKRAASNSWRSTGWRTRPFRRFGRNR